MKKKVSNNWMEWWRTPKGLFYAVSIVDIVIMIFLLMLTQGEVKDKMSYVEKNACDFWNHIKRLLNYESLYGNLKDADAIFPPLAYMFLYPFARLMGFKNAEGAELEITGWGILVLTLYISFFTVSFAYTVDYAYKETKLKRILLVYIFLFSYPFWGFAFERGNPVIYAMLFLMLGIFLKDAKESWKRELALICVAASAGFKIYPAVFGMLWIKQKRYKEAARLLAYGIMAFFVPFAFIRGGGYAEKLLDYIGTFSRYLGKEYYSATGIIGVCVLQFGNNGETIGKLIVLLWTIYILYYLFSEKLSWKTIALMTSICTIILPEAYLYTYVYLAIPIICFFNSISEKNSYKILDWVYAFLFALALTIPPLDEEWGVQGGMFFCWLGILVLIFVEKLVLDVKNNLPKWKKYGSRLLK